LKQTNKKHLLNQLADFQDIFQDRMIQYKPPRYQKPNIKYFKMK